MRKILALLMALMLVLAGCAAEPATEPEQPVEGEETGLEFSTDEFYIKSEDEMRELFSEIPEAIDNTTKISFLFFASIKRRPEIRP